MHVVKPPGVGWETAYRRGFLSKHAFLAVAIGEVAVVIRLIGGNRFAKMKRRFRPGTASIFPFSLGRQAIRLLVFFPQFLDELLAIVPGNIFDREVLFALELAGIVAHDCLPLFLGHGMNAHVEALGQRDLVLGFVVMPSFFFLGTAHHEAPRRNPDELHADAVGEVLGRVFLLWR